MDLLGEILKQAGLQRRILNQRCFTQPIALAFPCARSFGFHVVTQGTCFIHTPGRPKPRSLGKGDVAFMARGIDHIISTEEQLPKKVITMAAEQTQHSLRETSKRPRLTLVSGAYQVWNQPVHPFFNQLPEWYVLKSDDVAGFDELHMAVRLLAAEVSNPSFGSETATQGLLDLIFTYIIRRIIEAQDAEPKTWGYAVHDPQIRAALELMHGDHARGWTLDELAKGVGLSRAGFALKFRTTLGATPFHYLTTIRMQKAMELLAGGDQRIEAVAEAVGYKDAFGFSKVFKKVVGLPPREFRQKNASEQNDKWRFQA